VFALGSDRATTGPNDARSGDIPAEVDLQLASATQAADGSYACGTDWADDLSTGVITSDGLDLYHQLPAEDDDGGSSEPSAPEPVIGLDRGTVCIRNLGTAGAEISAWVIDIVETELGCSPSEDAVDPSCGSGPGDLASDLYTGVAARGPDGDCTAFDGQGTLRSMSGDGGGIRVAYLPAGGSMVLCPSVRWVETLGSQSDQVTWTYRFDGHGFDAQDGGTTCASDDDHEPDDTREVVHITPNGLDGDSPIDAISCADGNDDFFWVSSTVSSPMTFDLTWTNPDTDLDLILYGPGGTEVAYSPGSSSSAGIVIAPVGVYHAEVRHEGGPTTPYTLQLLPAS
jgi:hypothetical protein